MKSVFSMVGVVFAALLAASTQATPIISLSAAGQETSSVAGVTTVDFNAGTCAGYASCTGDFAIVSGSASGVYAAPAGDLTKYVTVPKPSPATHNAVFGLGTTANYFGLFWGSIDSYNSISFFLNNALVASFSGSDIVGSNANGNQISYSSNRYINFDFGSSLFDTVMLSSSGFAFESDNHAFRQASVSEPGTLAMIGFGLMGLLAVRRLQSVR